MRRSCCLRRGWCTWRNLRKERSCCCSYFFQQKQSCDRLENANPQGSFGLNGCLVAQMTVRAMRVIRRIGMMPIADDAGSKNQQRNQRERDSEYANRFPHVI